MNKYTANMRVFDDSAITGRQRKARRSITKPEALCSTQIEASQSWEQVDSEW